MTQAANIALFRVRDADGVQRLEDGLLLYWTGGEMPVHLESLADFISKELFGTVRSELFVDWDEFESAEEQWEYEQALESSLLDDIDTAVFLKKFGLDFTDAVGNPLRCTRFLKLQAEAAAKSYCGHMPDRATASLGKLQNSLEAEASAFRARKLAQGR